MKLRTMVCLLSMPCLIGCVTLKKTGAPEKGLVLDLNGTALYGTAIEYTPDVYIGRLAEGATLELADTLVMKNKHNLPIIKVKVLGDEGYGKSSVGRTGWVLLKDTSFVDLYDSSSGHLDPERVTP